MFSRLEKILILIFLIFTTSIQFGYTYFVIEQCPDTSVDNIRLQTEFNEVSLIFYYAQWCKESLEALKQFNDVVSYFGDKVYFAAIDCWHLACNCSKTLSTTVGYGSPHKWPTMIVHYGRLAQLKIQYNGLFTFTDIVEFILNVMQPLERLEGREELERMKSVTNAVVLGVFEKPDCFQYQRYLITALKWLEHDPKRTYRFSVTFAKSAENFTELNVEKPNILMIDNKTEKYFTNYSDFKWNASSILHWLHDEINKDHRIMHGYSTPITITKQLKKQPVLSVFVNEPRQFFLYMNKYIDKQQPLKKALSCTNPENSKTKNNHEKLFLINNIIQSLKFFSDNSKCYYSKDTMLRNLEFYYEINEYFKHSHKYIKSDLEARELLNFFQSMACLRGNDQTLKTSFHINVVNRLMGYLENEKQSTNSNRSLAVTLLDTQRYKDFLETIDISPTHQSMATVFIIDNDKENMYVMEDRFAMHNLIQFVRKFYSNALNIYYKNKESIAVKPQLSYSSASYSAYDIELRELSRVIYINYLQFAHNQTLVVLIYSNDCALCGNIQQSFLQLSLSLRHLEDLKFIRINTMDNDLPWQFNMPFLPALLVFPENHFSESRLFPTHLKPDIINLFGFILCQLSAHQQIRLVLSMCQSGTLPQSHTQSCWQFAKKILMQHIAKHLQYWQVFEAERSLIFERLSAFKDMSLDIQRNLRL